MRAMREAGLIRLSAPRSLGGLEAQPPTCAWVIEAVARFDSATGWAIMVANSVDWWCSRLPDEGAVIICNGLPAAVEATAVDGGYRLRGRRPLASNIHDADWLMLTAELVTRDGEPAVIGAILPAREAEIVDTWYSLGMRGTDSNDVAVDGVFVPATRTSPWARSSNQGATTAGLSTPMMMRRERRRRFDVEGDTDGCGAAREMKEPGRMAWWPFAVALQGEAANHRKVRRSRAGVSSRRSGRPVERVWPAAGRARREPQAAGTARGKVAVRGTGADRLVVAVKAR